MKDPLLALVIAEVKSAIEGCQGDTFDKCVVACQAGKDHFMVDDSNIQIKGVFGGLLDHFGEGSKEYTLLQAEIKAISVIDAMMRGLPVDIEAVANDLPPDDEKSLGVGRIWRAIHKNEDLDDVRAEITGVPKQKGAPDWFKDDIDAAWKQWVGLQEEVSNCNRVCSNISFQRDWYSKTLGKLGISIIPPHPEYVGDGEAKDAAVQRLKEKIEAVYPDEKEQVPLTEEERLLMGKTLEAVLSGGLDRMCADIIRMVYQEIRTIYSEGGRK